jgi:hypothetical protein
MKPSNWLLALILFLSSASAYAEWCQRSYGNGRCPKCNVQGRAYQPIELAPTLTTCGLCNTFCQVSYRKATGNEDATALVKGFVTVPVDTERPMIVAAEKPLLYSVAATNPEASALLLTLVLRSRNPHAIPPEKGDGGSSFKFTIRGATEAISADGSPVAQQAGLSEEYSDPSHSSRWTWELVKQAGGGAAKLFLRHRVVNDKDELVATPYPDIEAQAEWTSIKRGGGYWRLTGWKVVQ